jgi:hypothetical protein
LLTTFFDRIKLFIASFVGAGARVRFEVFGKENIKVESITHVFTPLYFDPTSAGQMKAVDTSWFYAYRARERHAKALSDTA